MATSYMKKAAGKLFRRARGRGKRSDNDTTPKPEIFYLCDCCHLEISEGSLRYHCCECEHSYDLCQLCYEDKDEAHAHQQKLGKDHIFSTETQAPFRLVDAAFGDTLEQTFSNVFRLYPTRPVFGQYIPSKQCYEYINYSQLEWYVKQFASGLHRLVLSSTTQQRRHGKAGSYSTMVALCSVCRLEWYVCDLACLFLGIPTIGITATCDKSTIAYILNQTESAVAVCSNDLLSLFVSLASENCRHLKHIIVMDMKEDESVTLSEHSISADVKQSTMSSVVSGGEDNQIDLKDIKLDPSSIFTIAYTSGSTGAPKGCVFTRNTWNSRITRTHANFRKVWFSFHPPSHLLERRNLHAILVSGGRSGFYRGSMEHLFTDIAMVRPTIVAGTPRFYTTIYNQYLQALHVAYREYQAAHSKKALEMDQSTSSVTEHKEHNVDLDGEMADSQGLDVGETTPAMVPKTISRALSRAISVASETEGLESSDTALTGTDCQDDVAPHGFNPADVPWEVKGAVMLQFKNVLGGREITVSIGGAAVDPDVKKFVQTCFNGLAQEGYGTTEAGGIAFQDMIRVGVDLKLIDVPEMGYLTTDNPPRGEICVKSSDNISGYYKNPEETAEKFVDGYFRTGDIGVKLASDKIRIIDRKKNLFKLAQGEFVAPERIEGLFENSSLIEQVYVYGNVHQTNVVAVVVPYREALLEWWKRKKDNEEVLEADYDTLCTLQSTNHLYLTELRRIGKQQGLQGWEIPPAIILEPNPFSAENGLLTSTLKKSRPQLEKRYKARLEDLYLALGTSMGNRPLEQQVMECLRHLLSTQGVAVSDPTTSPPLSLSLTLTQLGGDSLAAMRISSLIQEAFCTDVSAQFLLKHALIDVYHLILSQLLPSQQPRSRIPSGSIDLNWEDEVDASFLKDVPPTKVRESDGEGEIVLLTGASGFLGRFILWELLHNESCRTVYCICRQGDGVSANDRVVNLLHTIASELHTEEGSVAQLMASKLVVLAGDLSKPCLGVSENSYVRIQEEVSLIIHCGAVVNSVLPYSALKEVNVCSTQRLLTLCLQGRPKTIHYVSTIGVFASLQWETLGEHSYPDPNRLHHLTGYSQSKWVAEQTVMRASKVAGITSSISRPGLVGPHSVSGHPNTRDWFYLLVTGIYRLGCCPTGPGCDDKRIPMVPVDTVAKGVVYLAMHTKSESRFQGVFHLVNSSRDNAVSFHDLVEIIRMFKPLNETDYSTFKALLSQQAKDTNDPVISSLNLVLPPQGGLPRSHFFTSDLTGSLLSSIDLDLTSLPQQYMSIYLEHLLENGCLEMK